MDWKEYQDWCINYVEKHEKNKYSDDCVGFIVWFVKSLDTKKCLVGNDMTDNYYEFTSKQINEENLKIYIDVYSKQENNEINFKTI